MAERTRHDGRRSDDPPRGRSSNGTARPRIGSVLAQARRDLQDLLGHPVERVASVAPDGDGWRLSIDVVELERIPDSTSVLGCYEVLLDEDGQVVEYERTRRYYRNRADDGET